MEIVRNDGLEMELDLTDLQVEQLDVAAAADEASLDRVTLWSVGHGMTEIGASCCSCNQGDGSCGGGTEIS